MPKRRPEFFIVDILIAIDKIKRKTVNLTFDEFVSDEDIVDVAMRNLEIIGEATNQLLKQSNFLEGTNIEWRKIVDFRNVVAHCYFGIDFDIVFKDIIKTKIFSLEQDILRFIKQRKDNVYFLQAIMDSKADFEEIHRHESIAYLDKIEKLIK